jgi:hypothetical protein
VIVVAASTAGFILPSGITGEAALIFIKLPAIFAQRFSYWVFAAWKFLPL